LHRASTKKKRRHRFEMLRVKHVEHIGSCEIGERVSFFFSFYYAMGMLETRVLPNALSRTVAFLVFKEQVGKLL
jgi:hypothetical protein